MDGYFVISGCSGGGKSSLLAELARRGHATVEEPGRRIVREELDRGGAALPWADVDAFVRRLVATALEDYVAAARLLPPVFFDRGLIDAAAALQHLTGEPVVETIARFHPYNARVFVAPPWPELFVADAERRHSFEWAVREHERLLPLYAALGYEIVELPKVPIPARADWLLAALETAITA